MRTARVIAALSLLLICLPAAADTIRADRYDSQYLALGAQPQYESVGRIDLRAKNGSFIGSGTLIAPDWVLTAGHMLDRARSLSFTIEGTTYSADRWVANPGWRGSLSSGTDIGLMHLSSSVAGIAPAQRYTGGSELGATATFVGYGRTGTGVTGATIFDGQKRGAQNVLDAYYPTRKSVNNRILMADFDSPTNPSESRLGSASPLDLEGLIAPGDSGGGVFIDVGTQTFLAGVNSFGLAYDGKVDSDYGDLSGHTRVSSFNAWINSILGPAAFYGTMTGLSAGGGLGDASAMNGAVPEPASMTLLVLGGAVLAFRRKLRRTA